jgi:hypothetical protein
MNIAAIAAFAATTVANTKLPIFTTGRPGLGKSQHVLPGGFYDFDDGLRESVENYCSVDYSGSMPDAFLDGMAREIKSIMLDRRVGEYVIPFKRNPNLKFTPKPHQLPSVKRFALLNSVAITG